MSPRALPEGIDNIDYTGDEDLKIYTKIYRQDSNNYYVSEVEGQIVPGSEGQYKKDLMPWIALRMVHLDGEDYGRSFVEEYLGDLKSLEGLMEALVSSAAASAKLVFMVRPNAMSEELTLHVPRTVMSFWVTLTMSVCFRLKSIQICVWYWKPYSALKNVFRMPSCLTLLSA